MQESVIDFPKAGLCPDVWEKVVDDTGLGDIWKLRQEVKDKLLAIMQELQLAQLLPDNGLTIHVTGSITSNQYTENADIDLHFHSDSLQFNSNDEVDALNKQLRSAYKQEFIGKHPIEIYYQDNKFQDYMSVGCYDVINDIWEVGPELVDSSFNPYAEYYDEAKKQSEAMASQIRNKILSIYETAIALKKNLGTEFGQNLRGVLLEQLASVQALYDNIRKTRKVYSSPTSKEEALQFRTSRKWHIADTAFKLFDKYGYIAILKSFIQIFDIISSSELTDIEACDNIVKEVRDYIGNADKLMDSEFYETALSESKKKKSSASMSPVEYSQYLLQKLGVDLKYIPKHDLKSIMDSLANEYIMKAPTDTVAREIEMDAALLLVKSDSEENIKLGKKLGDMIIDGKGGDKMLAVMRKAWLAFLHMPGDVNESVNTNSDTPQYDRTYNEIVKMICQSDDLKFGAKDKLNRGNKCILLWHGNVKKDKYGFDDYSNCDKVWDPKRSWGLVEVQTFPNHEDLTQQQADEAIQKAKAFISKHSVEQVDEGAKEAISAGLLAALLAIPGILSAKTVQKAIDNNQKYEMIVKDLNQNVRMIGNYTAFQAGNIIARTLYAEARNDGKVGMEAVASVIFNRAEGDKMLFTKVCLKPKQFSCWNKFTKEEADPKNFKIKIPSSVKGNTKNEKLWKEAMAIAADMLVDAFTPTIKANTYFNPKTANPKWASDLLNSKMIGSHKFGTIKHHSPFV